MVLRADLTVIVEASGDDDGDETYVATVLYAPSSTSEWALAPLWTPNATLALDSDGLLVAPITVYRLRPGTEYATSARARRARERP